LTAYRYLGFDERTYPDIVVPGEGTLVAKPGDVRELDEAPGDDRWEAAVELPEAEPAEPEPEPVSPTWTEDN
jgi:hypothetical protein